MKSRFLILFTISWIACCGYSQKVEFDGVNNEVRLIESKTKVIKFPKFPHIWGYRLEKYISSDGNSQFFLCGVSELNEYHNFPVNSKILLKTVNDKIIELTSVYSHYKSITAYDWVPEAFFPITLNQLEILFNGISKIRVERMSYDKIEEKPYIEYPEKEFKKDEMGKNLKEMFTNIELQCKKEIKKEKRNNKKKTLERSTDNSNF